MSNFEELLRKSLEERKNKPLRAVNELNAAVLELSAAVGRVTGGRLKCVLEPLKARDNRGPAFAVVLRLPDADRALRVVEFSREGYPAGCYDSYELWDDPPPNTRPWNVRDIEQLRQYIEQLLSSPDAELVRLIANELVVAGTEREPALAG